MAESFFSSLKKKRIRKQISVWAMSRTYIFDYIEMFYNRIRRHNHLGIVSPEDFEKVSS